MAKQPRIGVVSDYHAGTLEKFGGDEAHQFLNSRYTRSIEHAGGLPWLLPVPENTDMAESYVAELSGLLMTGCGRHTDPATYGQKPMTDLGACMAAEKQRFEFAIYLAARKKDLPVLAICGGLQSLNVATGGTLIQRIGEQVKNPLAHMQESKAVNTVHDVSIVPGTALAAITGETSLPVNSSHTQSVDKPGTGLIVNATAPDGVVEGLESEDGRVIAVQWHPEYLYEEHPAQARLFAHLVQGAGGGG